MEFMDLLKEWLTANRISNDRDYLTQTRNDAWDKCQELEAQINAMISNMELAEMMRGIGKGVQ
jgi:hypothetical protein